MKTLPELQAGYDIGRKWVDFLLDIYRKNPEIISIHDCCEASSQSAKIEALIKDLTL